MTWTAEKIDLGTRITGLAVTDEGDLQIDMEGFETLIVTPEEFESWLRLCRDLAAYGQS